MRSIHLIGVVATASLWLACGISPRERAERTGRIDSPVVADGNGGFCTEMCWIGGFNYYTHNCHDAANAGVDAGNDGIISCEGTNYGHGGHTFNYDRVSDTQVCVSEPQLPGSAACCWEDVGTGAPDLSTDAAINCIGSMCPAGQWGPPAALPPGQTWDVCYLNCLDNNDTLADCDSCCDANANNTFAGLTLAQALQAAFDAENYRTTCKTACANTYGGPPPPPWPPVPPPPPPPPPPDEEPSP